MESIALGTVISEFTSQINDMYKADHKVWPACY